MHELGICKQSGRLYEGNSNNGTPAIGSVNLLPISFIGVEIQNLLPEFNGYSGHLFREDSFDPITKVRRGRVYRMNGSQPQFWHVHDFIRNDLNSVSWNGGQAPKLEAVGYQQDSLSYLRSVKELPTVQLGQEPFASYWQILTVETLANGRPQLTLKAKHSFTTIPELIPNQVPSDVFNQLRQSLEKVENSANRLGPVDTIDRCRDLLSIVFGALENDLSLDLGAGITKRRNKNKNGNSSKDGHDLITVNADIVRRLHSRGKPNEEHKHNTRGLTDKDADLALTSLWFVLVELGWAR